MKVHTLAQSLSNCRDLTREENKEKRRVDVDSVCKPSAHRRVVYAMMRGITVEYVWLDIRVREYVSVRVCERVRVRVRECETSTIATGKGRPARGGGDERTRI